MVDRNEIEALALEGLDYFEKAGDDGDKVYVRAIRELLASRLSPPAARVPEGWTVERVPGAAAYKLTDPDGEWVLWADTGGVRFLDALLAAPAPEAVITQGVAAHIKGRIDALAPANNLSRFLDHPAPPPADHSPGAGNMVPDAGQREGVDWLAGNWRVSGDAQHIFHDNFDSDVMLTLSGDFESCQHRHDVANAIAERLASAPQPTQRGGEGEE